MTAASGSRNGGGSRVERVVPVYALTRGRTRPVSGRELPVEAVVTATELAAEATHDLTLQLEWRAIVKLCVWPMSVAEIGVALGVPVGVARVLVSELAGAGYLMVHLPRLGADDTGPSSEILGRLLDGLRAR